MITAFLFEEEVGWMMHNKGQVSFEYIIIFLVVIIVVIAFSVAIATIYGSEKTGYEVFEEGVNDKME